jgi:MioC protein
MNKRQEALMQILVLIVTMTGTAEMVSEDIRDAYPDHQWTLKLIEDSTTNDLCGIQHVIVASSTYGQGEIPGPGQSFYAALAASRLDLSCLRYGVIALGDSVYAETFANGGRLWDELLAASGATRLAPILRLDASGPQDMSASAIAWIAEWLKAACANGNAETSCSGTGKSSDARFIIAGLQS